MNVRDWYCRNVGVSRHTTEDSTKKLLFLSLVIVFVKGIYKHIPETNHVSSVHSVAAVLYLNFVLHVMLFCPRNMLIIIIIIVVVVVVVVTSPTSLRLYSNRFYRMQLNYQYIQEHIISPKDKVHPVTCNEVPEVEYRYSSTLTLTSALFGVGGQLHAPATLSPGKIPVTH
jgi:sensor histidine kinase YesM